MSRDVAVMAGELSPVVAPRAHGADPRAGVVAVVARARVLVSEAGLVLASGQTVLSEQVKLAGVELDLLTKELETVSGFVAPWRGRSSGRAPAREAPPRTAITATVTAEVALPGGCPRASGS